MDMRKFLLIAFTAMSVFAIQAQDTKFNVTGIVPDDVKTVYLQVMGQRSVADSAAVSGGKFTLTGTMPANSILVAYAGNYGVPFFNDGTPVSFDLTAKTLDGSELNKKLFGYDKEIDGMQAPMKDLIARYRGIKGDSESEKAEKKEIEKKAEEISNAVAERELAIIKENKDNLIPAFYIGQVFYELTFDELNELLSPSAPYYNHPALTSAKKQLESLEKRKPGKMFTDLTMNDTEGKAHKLSDWCGKGNYVLIDFWASWCGPCRQEMPNVVENYAKYHSKGFEIIGVSYDNKAEAWKAAIGKLGMKWPQLSDLKGWKSASSPVYGITSIPSNVLLDKEGKIIASDLRGEDLGNKLKEIYGF